MYNVNLNAKTHCIHNDNSSDDDLIPVRQRSPISPITSRSSNMT